MRWPFRKERKPTKGEKREAVVTSFKKMYGTHESERKAILKDRESVGSRAFGPFPAPLPAASMTAPLPSRPGQRDGASGARAPPGLHGGGRQWVIGFSPSSFRRGLRRRVRARPLAPRGRSGCQDRGSGENGCFLRVAAPHPRTACTLSASRLARVLQLPNPFSFAGGEEVAPGRPPSSAGSSFGAGPPPGLGGRACACACAWPRRRGEPCTWRRGRNLRPRHAAGAAPQASPPHTHTHPTRLCKGLLHLETFTEPFWMVLALVGF